VKYARAYLRLVWSDPEHRHSLVLVAIVSALPFAHYVLGVI